MKVNLQVQKKDESDNVDQFKDLFATAKSATFTQSAPKRVIDLTYNPGVQPPSDNSVV